MSDTLQLVVEITSHSSSQKRVNQMSDKLQFVAEIREAHPVRNDQSLISAVSKGQAEMDSTNTPNGSWGIVQTQPTPPRINMMGALANVDRVNLSSSIRQRAEVSHAHFVGRI